MMMRRAPKDASTRRAAPRSMPAKADKKPSLDTFIQNGDFTGAIALLEFERRAGTETPMTLPWLGYAAFHLGDYKKAWTAYQVGWAPHHCVCPVAALRASSVGLGAARGGRRGQEGRVVGPAVARSSRYCCEGGRASGPCRIVCAQERACVCGLLSGYFFSSYSLPWNM